MHNITLHSPLDKYTIVKIEKPGCISLTMSTADEWLSHH